MNVFSCSDCRHPSLSWFALCRACGKPDTCRAIAKAGAVTQSVATVPREVVSLSSVPADNDSRHSSGISGFDSVTGGGIVAGSVIVLCGAPGSGKSTLALQVAEAVSERETVLYIAGEETPARLSARAQRLKLDSSRILVCSYVEMLSIGRVLARERPALCVVDSLQSLYSSRLKSRVGSPSQLITCANSLVRAAQAHEIAVLVVAHMTKDATLAGPRTVEHDVDAMLYFEADDSGSKGAGDRRILYATKNRFGPAFVPAVFRMTAKGLVDCDPDDE